MTRWLEPYMRVPFKARGRNLSGFDCWGSVALIFKDRANITLDPFADIAPGEGSRIAAAIAAAAPSWIHVALGSEKELDVVVMRDICVIDGKAATADMHVGIVVAPGQMFHVEKGIGGMLVRIDDPSVKDRVRHIHRHRALA
jgi:cell wall-associated NlpC family hydrolase